MGEWRLFGEQRNLRAKEILVERLPGAIECRFSIEIFDGSKERQERSNFRESSLEASGLLFERKAHSLSFERKSYGTTLQLNVV